MGERRDQDVIERKIKFPWKHTHTTRLSEPIGVMDCVVSFFFCFTHVIKVFRRSFWVSAIIRAKKTKINQTIGKSAR